MVQIPFYEQRTNANAPLTPANQRAVRDTSGVGEALSQAGQAMGNFAEAKMRSEEQKARAWAASAMAEYDLTTYTDFEKSKAAAPIGASDFNSNFIGRLNDYSKKTLANAPNEFAKNILKGHIEQRTAEYGQQAFKFEQDETNRYHLQQFSKAVDNHEKYIYTLPYDRIEVETQKAIVNQAALLKGMAVTPEVRQQEQDSLIKRLTTAATLAKIQNDPDSLIRDIKPYEGGFDSAMNVVARNEGGFVAVDGASGAPAIFGINAKWYPQEFKEAQAIAETQGDAAGKAYAAQFYKSEFWDKNNIDEYDADQQLVLFDGAINHGSVFRAKLLDAAKSGATASELVDMRRAEYQRLAQNPKHEASLNGWMSRLDTIESRLTGNQMKTGQSTFDMLSSDEQQKMIAESKTQALHNAKLRKEAAEAAKKAADDALLDEGLRIMVESNGDFNYIPPNLRYQLKTAGLWDDVAKYTGTDNELVLTELYNKSPEELAAIDLSEYRFGLSRETSEKFLAKQQAARESVSNKSVLSSTSDIIKETWRSTGLDTNHRDFGKYNFAVENALTAAQEKNGGKPLTNQDVRGITSSLLINKGLTRAYQKRIAGDNTEFFGGITPQQSDDWSRALTRAGVAVSEKNVKKIIKNPSEFVQINGLSGDEVNMAYGAVSLGVPPFEVKAIIETLVAAGKPVTKEAVLNLHNITPKRK